MGASRVFTPTGDEIEAEDFEVISHGELLYVATAEGLASALPSPSRPPLTPRGGTLRALPCSAEDLYTPFVPFIAEAAPSMTEGLCTPSSNAAPGKNATRIAGSGSDVVAEGNSCGGCKGSDNGRSICGGGGLLDFGDDNYHNTKAAESAGESEDESQLTADLIQRTEASQGSRPVRPASAQPAGASCVDSRRHAHTSGRQTPGGNSLWGGWCAMTLSLGIAFFSAAFARRLVEPMPLPRLLDGGAVWGGNVQDLLVGIGICEGGMPTQPCECEDGSKAAHHWWSADRASRKQKWLHAADGGTADLRLLEEERRRSATTFP